MGGGVQMGFSNGINLIAEGAGQCGQGMLVLPPHCEICLVRTLLPIPVYIQVYCLLVSLPCLIESQVPCSGSGGVHFI